MKTIILISLVFLFACTKSEINAPEVNPIYQEDLQPLQGTWSNAANYLIIFDKSVVMNLCDTLACDSLGNHFPNYYHLNGSEECGDTIVYHGSFWYIDSRGMTLNLNERGYWSFQYEFDGPDSLWLNRDSIPGSYRNILFIKN